MPISRQDCLQRDQQDALAPLRAQFALPEGVIYLDGNSLGAQPRAALARAQQVVAQEWGVGLIRSWNSAGWFELPQRLSNQLARLIGAGANEVVVTDTTSINRGSKGAGMIYSGPKLCCTPYACATSSGTR